MKKADWKAYKPLEEVEGTVVEMYSCKSHATAGSAGAAGASKGSRGGWGGGGGSAGAAAGAGGSGLERRGSDLENASASRPAAGKAAAVGAQRQGGNSWQMRSG